MNTALNELLSVFDLDSKNAGTWIGKKWLEGSGHEISSFSPINGVRIASVMATDLATYQSTTEIAVNAFKEWRMWPAPKRGEVVRQIGEAFRQNKSNLARLISFEMGKSISESLGEVQEVIDICDFAVGLSRQLGGYMFQSERPGHRMFEQYHPLGVVGIISSFNFPVAVWSWNAMLAWVCGDVCIWKPSEKTPLCAIACQSIIAPVLTRNKVPDGVACLINGGKDVGEWLAADRKIALISATGSTKMGREVGVTVASRFGRVLLELGGNNAIIISKECDLKVALLSSLFGAIGTAGQRCTTTRRLIIHESIYESFKKELIEAYDQLKIGDPLNEKNHIGPLIDRTAVQSYVNAIATCKQQGGKFIVPGQVLQGLGYESECYVKPCIAEVDETVSVMYEETFAPILYIMKYQSVEDAIRIQNDVPQGLSSAIITSSLRESELFLSVAGSDCGMANVNMATSGAEIGGAFGGEKETGGGRESGSDAWKAYMRRQTNTINFSADIALAQGIRFSFSS